MISTTFFPGLAKDYSTKAFLDPGLQPLEKWLGRVRGTQAEPNPMSKVRGLPYVPQNVIILTMGPPNRNPHFLETFNRLGVLGVGSPTPPAVNMGSRDFPCPGGPKQHHLCYKHDHLARSSGSCRMWRCEG